MRLESPNVMTVADVKAYLQITDASFDAAIELFLPIVSGDLQQICNQPWVIEVEGDLTTASAVISNTSTLHAIVGGIVTTSEFSNSKIVSIDDDAESITVSDNSTDDITDAEVLVNIFPNRKKMIAAQMVWYQIQSTSGEDKAGKGYQSERFGNYNYTLEDGEGRTTYGYPASLIRGLSDVMFARFY